MSKHKVLLAGESWVSTATHIKGFDQFPTVTYHTGADELLKALKDSDFDVKFMPAHEAQRDFPQTAEALSEYDAIILSDIGANTLLLHPDTWIHSKRTPNRLRLLRDYVRNGGALLMFGGYYSFQGINGGARYHKTAVEEVLPVTCLSVDDRVEVPEGFTPVVTGAGNHPILQGLGKDWPILLGYNEVTVKDGAEVLATVSTDYGSQPLLVTGT
ncbi:MAG TPA: glutamine amidotransferase, partial [Phyllobacterium sp.]|nr:glutamine amidotransferase [Phyllobacterium sp.]